MNHYKKKMFIQYIKQYKFIGLLFVVFAAIFWTILFFYNSNTEAVLYAAILCIFVVSILIMLHFNRFIKKHKSLQKCVDNANFNPMLVNDELSVPSDIIEEDYQAIIQTILANYKNQCVKAESLRQDMIDYYSTWVHQIKTPIAAMQMKLQMEDTESNRKLLADLFHIEQYVEMVLCYIRLDSESSDLILKKYDLDSILKESIHKYASEFVHKRLSLDYKQAHRQVLTDEKWLSFIIDQVLFNAIKYTNKGSITIFLNDEDVLIIRDTGIGISAEDLPRIFEKGYTGYNGRLQKKSTGIGLYLSKKAADKLSCRMWIESELEKGTSVYIDLHKSPLELE